MTVIMWHLWRMIRYPMRQNPIFKYGQRLSVSSNASSPWIKLLQGLSVALIVCLLVLFPVAIGFGVIGFLVGLPILLILCSATILGAYTTLKISNRLSSIRRDERDLLLLTEYGSLGAAFWMALGVLHRSNWLMRFYQVILGVVRIVVVLLAIAALLLAVNLGTTNNVLLQQQQIRVLRDSIALCLIVTTFWLDFVQSMVLALLLAILTPATLNDALLVRGITPLVYVGMQIVIYLATALMYVLSRVLLLGIFGDAGWLFWVNMLLIPLCLYFAREILLSLMLSLIFRFYDASQQEFQYIIRPS